MVKMVEMVEMGAARGNVCRGGIASASLRASLPFQAQAAGSRFHAHSTCLRSYATARGNQVRLSGEGRRGLTDRRVAVRPA